MATSARAPASAIADRDALVITNARVAAVAAFIAVHMVLAVVMRSSPLVATGHALVTAVVSLFYTATTRRLRTIPVVVAYIVGCEVLWRMSKATVFWEFGKYTSAAILVIGLLRIRWDRGRLLPIAYFGLLLPSAALTLLGLDSETARQQISFNLAGPLVIALAILFFSSIRPTAGQLYAALIALIGPIAGIGVLSAISTARTTLEFVNASTAATSGGYAANQVSAMLGLGVLSTFLISLDRRIPWRFRIPLLAMGVVMGTQATLTFARGGIVLAGASLAGAAFFLLKGNARARGTVIIVGILTSLLGRFVIEPRLEELTKGELSVRYTDSSSTGRNLFIESELEMFYDHPLLGVGPGMGTELRRELGLFEGASHTEYSRMLGEHGVFGALSLCCLIALWFRAFRSARTRDVRARVVAMLIWVVLFLGIYSTRLAAPAFVLGLAFLRPPIPGAPRP